MPTSTSTSTSSDSEGTKSSGSSSGGSKGKGKAGGIVKRWTRRIRRLGHVSHVLGHRHRDHSPGPAPEDPPHHTDAPVYGEERMASDSHPAATRSGPATHPNPNPNPDTDTSTSSDAYSTASGRTLPSTGSIQGSLCPSSSSHSPPSSYYDPDTASSRYTYHSARDGEHAEPASEDQTRVNNGVDLDGSHSRSGSGSGSRDAGDQPSSELVSASPADLVLPGPIEQRTSSATGTESSESKDLHRLIQELGEVVPPGMSTVQQDPEPEPEIVPAVAEDHDLPGSRDRSNFPPTSRLMDFESEPSPAQGSLPPAGEVEVEVPDSQTAEPSRDANPSPVWYGREVQVQDPLRSTPSLDTEIEVARPLRGENALSPDGDDRVLLERHSSVSVSEAEAEEGRSKADVRFPVPSSLDVQPEPDQPEPELEPQSESTPPLSSEPEPTITTMSTPSPPLESSSTTMSPPPPPSIQIQIPTSSQTPPPPSPTPPNEEGLSPSPPPVPPKPESTATADDFLADSEDGSEDEGEGEGEKPPPSPGDEHGQQHEISLAPSPSPTPTPTPLNPPSASPAPIPAPASLPTTPNPLPPSPTSSSEEEEAEDQDVYLPALTHPTMFLPIPNTDPLTTLLTKHVPDPTKRPERDTSGEWQGREFHGLVMTNSWRALAKMARDRIVSCDREDVSFVLNLWYLRLSSLARLRLTNQASAELTNLFSALLSQSASLDRLPVPFELEVLHARGRYWQGDHLGYLDALTALVGKCKKKAREAGRRKRKRRGEEGVGEAGEEKAMWVERGARVCLILASQLIEMKDFTAATRILTPLLASSVSPDLRSAIGRVYLQSGQLSEASKVFSSVEADPEAGQDVKDTNAALLAAAEGDWAMAIQALRRLLERDGQNFMAVNNLAVALLSQGRLKEGIQILEAALQASPSSVTVAEPFLFNLSTLYELRAAITADKKRDLLIEVAKWSGDGLKTACLKMPSN